MNRAIFFFLVCISFSANSQVSFNSWTNSYMQINSYNGNSNLDAYTVKFDGNGNLNIPNWRLSANLKGSVLSSDGEFTIPSNKISFQPIVTTGQADPKPIPSFSEIGAPSTVFLQENAEVFLIPNANAALFNNPSQPNAYYFLQMKFGITLIGGAYLGQYPAWTTFVAPIEFTAYDQNNSVIGRLTHNFQFQIGNITDTPPVENKLSLKVNMNASNGMLEFKTLEDYTNGTSVTYAEGILVESNSNFQIKVRSLQNDLQSNSGYSIPVDVVHLELTPTKSENQRIYSIVLSPLNQVLVNANILNNTSFYYDIKYFTLAQDLRLINAKPDDYATTLQYEITPQ